MSLVREEIRVRPSVTSSLNIGREVHYDALIGGSEVTYQQVTSTSYSQSQANFTANPPSPGVVVDRHVLLKQPVTLTFNGTPEAGSRLLQSGYDAFRAMPLHSVMNTLQLGLNNSKLTLNASEVIHEMMRYYGDERDQEHLSLTPAYMDQSQEYDDLVNTNRNPLAQFGEKDSGVPKRGGFPYTAINNPVDGVQATVDAVLTEPLMISPLLWGPDESKGLVRVQNMNVTINWDSDLSRMWSHAAGSGSVISSITVSLGQPSLLFKYITPPATMEIPKSIDYRYNEVEVYTTELNNPQASNSTYPMNSSNIQLNTVPSHLLVYVKERRSDRTYATTDSWQSIESLTMSFANRSGIFSGARKQELYRISRSNGMNQSWAEWSGESMFVESGSSELEKHGVAGVFVAKFGRDIPITDPSVTVGTPGTFNLQLTVNVKNQNQERSINPALYVVPIYEGILTLADNQAIQQLAILSQEDVLDAASKANDAAFDEADVEGGGFWRNVEKNFRSALPYIRKGRKLGQAISGSIPVPEAQAVKGVLDAAEAVGLGAKRGRKAAPKAGSLVGGTYVGGAKMSRSQMKSMLGL